MHNASIDGVPKPRSINIQKMSPIRQKGSIWWISNLEKVSLRMKWHKRLYRTYRYRKRVTQSRHQQPKKVHSPKTGNSSPRHDQESQSDDLVKNVNSGEYSDPAVFSISWILLSRFSTKTRKRRITWLSEPKPKAATSSNVKIQTDLVTYVNDVTVINADANVNKLK